MKRFLLVFVLGLVGFLLYAETFTVKREGATAEIELITSEHPRITFPSREELIQDENAKAEKEMREPSYKDIDFFIGDNPGYMVVFFNADTLDKAKQSKWLVIVRDANGKELERSRGDPKHDSVDYYKSASRGWFSVRLIFFKKDADIEFPLFVRLAPDYGTSYDFSISREEEQEDQNE
jgi:hypothetical protein